MSIDPSCYRTQSKRDRTPTPQQFKGWWMKAYTPDDVIKMIRELPAEKYLDGWFKMLPKEVKVESDTQISLIINGVRQVQAIDGRAQAALQAHEDDDATE